MSNGHDKEKASVSFEADRKKLLEKIHPGRNEAEAPEIQMQGLEV